MLRTTDLTVRFGHVTALDRVSVEVPAGETLAVLGPSGCGKSTLLRAVAGLERPEDGQVCFDGEDLAGVPTHRRGFALLFQDGQLFPHLSVAQNVAYPLRLRRWRRGERAARVAELLALVGIAGYGDRDPATLSGGERQRVALARALAVEPRLLLLDEPLSALDRDLRERLATDLRTILHDAGTTAVLVTHDHEEAFLVADRLAVMRTGAVVQQGTVDAVWRAPEDRETARFLGYARVLDAAEAARLLAATGATAPEGAAAGEAAGDAAGDAGGGAPATGAAHPRAHPLALRRSALRVRADGPLLGVVRAARTTPEVTRLVVDLDCGLEGMDAVAGLAHGYAPGDGVRLVLDRTRTATVASLD